MTVATEVRRLTREVARKAARRAGSAAAVPLLAVLGVTLAACGGGDGGAGPASSATPSAAPSSTSSTSPSPSISTSASTSTSGTPAAGPSIALSSITLNLPSGWSVQSSSDSNASGFDPGRTRGQLRVYDLASVGGETLDSEARYALANARQTGTKPVRQPDRTVDGHEGYVITGGSSLYPVYYVFGTVTDGHDVRIIIQFGADTPQAQPVIESILASVQLT